MLREIITGLVLGAGLLVMLGSIEALRRRFDLETEHTRKMAHLLGGIALVSLPWLFTTAVVPAGLAVAFLGVLGVSKWRGWLPSVHGIQRRSSGAHLFPVAAFTTFVLSDGDPLLYAVPMLILAVSDAAAALVGRRFGRRLYRVSDQTRSLEGSSAFLVTAFAVTAPALVLGGVSAAVAVPLALVVALLLTGVEAICTGGFDNLVIPLAALFVLGAFGDLPAPVLWGYVVVVAGLLGFAFVSFRRWGMSFAASLAVFFVGAGLLSQSWV
jgi:phytol kinase